MSHQLTLIICFWLFIQVVSFTSCHPMKESLFIFDRTENITKFSFLSVGREGSVGLGFSTTNIVTKESLLLLFTSPNSFFELQNHVEKKPKNELIYDVKIENTFNSIIDNYNSIYFTINNTYLKDKDYVFLSRYRGTGNLTTSKHQDAFVYGFSILNTTENFDNCSPENLRGYRIFMSFLPLGLPRFLITLLVFILLVYYRNGQPLKSRTFGPYYICLSELIEFMSISIRDALTIRFDIQNDCWIFATITYPTIYMLTSVVTSFYSRYLIVNNLNQQKKVYANGKLPFFYVLLGQFDKLSIFTILPLFSYFYMSAVLWIVIAIYPTQCSRILQNILLIVSIIHIVANFMVVIICVIYDVICNIQLIFTCKFKEFFITRDPFRIRIELCFISTFIFPIIGVSISLIFRLPHTLGYLFFDIGLLMFFFTSCIFPLIMTMINRISLYCTRKPRNSENDLEVIFKDPTFQQALIVFSEHEFSPENVLFKLDMDDYLKTPQNQREKYIEKIDQKYFQITSPYEVNIDGNSKKKLRKSLEECKMKGKYPNDLFDDITTVVYTNLADTYSRFILSTEYKTAVAKVSLLGNSFIRVSRPESRK